MNKHFTLLLLVFMCACKGTVSHNDASISFSNDKYDFGTIPYKKEATYSFEFSNSGKTMLIINNIKTSCGCTVPEWSKEPIRPGRKGQITIKYGAEYPGVFHKTIDVIYNGLESHYSLEIKGEVKYPEEDTK
ncbi:MAG: DUF1573 domain-containing protein [Bacteroidota bacterium]|nr:DUF1573 domain-containing protein [Bacteroidota bacterium]